MMSSSISLRPPPQEVARHAVRLAAPCQASPASDAEKIQRILGDALGDAAALACRPWLAAALSQGGTWWHGGLTDAGLIWLTITVLSDGGEERHALLTLDSERGEAALQARLAAARLDAMIQTAGALCHSVNNALTALLGNAEMLLETEGLPEDAQASARMILRAGERLDALTSRTLRLGRARHPPAGRCDPHDQLHAVCATLRQEGAPGARWNVSIARDLGTLLVQPATFAEAAAHLLRNATTAAGPAGHVLLRAECEASLAWPGFAWLGITVEDDGPGLPAEELGFPGAGFLAGRRAGHSPAMGLASVRAFTTALGGSLEAESVTENAGARLTIRLPVLRRRDAAS